MDKTFFSVEDFSCGYPGFKLSNIHFSLKKGSFTGIIGPNGSGKTTLFRGISGALPTLKGNISLEGKILRNLKLKERARRIAIVNQIVDADQMQVEEYVLMGRIPYQSRFCFFETNEDVALAHHYMELTGVLKHRNKLMSELSGGEQQRAAIARALTQQPDLLLLDEPTAHLDITHQVRILNLLQQLNEETGLTILMVIHDLNLASEYCDHLIMFTQGEVYTQGLPDQVLSYQHIETVYRTPVVTRINPYSGKPVIFLISGKMTGNNQNIK